MAANVKLIKLNNGDRIKFEGKIYKIMEEFDLSYMNIQMGMGLKRLEKEIELIKTKDVEIIHGDAVALTEKIFFRGMVQSLKLAELMIKPEEQRSYKWIRVSTFSLQGRMDYHCIYIDQPAKVIY
jgi:hypothetical protein